MRSFRRSENHDDIDNQCFRADKPKYDDYQLSDALRCHHLSPVIKLDRGNLLDALTTPDHFSEALAALNDTPPNCLDGSKLTPCDPIIRHYIKKKWGKNNPNSIQLPIHLSPEEAPAW